VGICTTVAAAPVLPLGYVVSASRIADRRIILAGYRLVDLLTRVVGNYGRRGFTLGPANQSERIEIIITNSAIAKATPIISQTESTVTTGIAIRTPLIYPTRVSLLLYDERFFRVAWT
jgi:hypothetical protein